MTSRIFLSTQSIYYDDVNLIAQPGSVKSRKDIKIDNNRIMIAPMSSIIGGEFIDACLKLPNELKPTLCIPRVNNAIDLIEKGMNDLNIVPCIGLDNSEIEEFAIDNKLTVLIDIANGYLPQLYKKIEKLRTKVSNIIAGNVHTKKGAENLIKSGANYIRCGISNGAVCTTKFATGFNRGQITEISEIFELENYYDFNLIADGGIKYTSDIVKAFGAGATHVMCGGMFSNCLESKNIANKEFKYYGMASNLGKSDMNSSGKFIEGKVVNIESEQNPKLKDVLYMIWDGIRSGISYSGFKSIEDFIGLGTFELKK